jgi:hypothetical protein
MMPRKLLVALDAWRHRAQAEPEQVKLLIRVLGFCALGEAAGELLQIAATTDAALPDHTDEIAQESESTDIGPLLRCGAWRLKDCKGASPGPVCDPCETGFPF